MKLLDDDNYDDNENASSAVLCMSMPTRCVVPSVCDLGDGHQIWSVAGNIE